MTTPHDESGQTSAARGHEQSDLSIRVLFGGLAAWAALTVVCAVGMIALWGALQGRQASRLAPVSPLVETDVTPPEPRLETSPSEVRDRIDALRQMQGTTYTWLDRQAGIARIPVSRAMEILAERGLPHRSRAEQNR